MGVEGELAEMGLIITWKIALINLFMRLRKALPLVQPSSQVGIALQELFQGHMIVSFFRLSFTSSSLASVSQSGIGALSLWRLNAILLGNVLCYVLHKGMRVKNEDQASQNN